MHIKKEQRNLKVKKKETYIESGCYIIVANIAVKVLKDNLKI